MLDLEKESADLSQKLRMRDRDYGFTVELCTSLYARCSTAARSALPSPDNARSRETASASPATGLASSHKAQQQALVDEALTIEGK